MPRDAGVVAIDARPSHGECNQPGDTLSYVWDCVTSGDQTKCNAFLAEANGNPPQPAPTFDIGVGEIYTFQVTVCYEGRDNVIECSSALDSLIGVPSGQVIAGSSAPRLEGCRVSDSRVRRRLCLRPEPR